MGAGQIRSAPSCIRRHESDLAEQPIAADCDPVDLRAEGRRIRDVYGRWVNLLLERLRWRGTNGRTWQLHRSAHWSFDYADARSGDIEAAGPAEVSVDLRAPEPPRGSFDKEAAKRGKHLFRNEAGCATCHQGSTYTDVLKGSSKSRALPSRSGGSGHGFRHMRPEPRPESIALRRYAGCGNAHPIFMMAARRICWQL